jgi:hypothetical protein
MVMVVLLLLQDAGCKGQRAGVRVDSSLTLTSIRGGSRKTTTTTTTTTLMKGRMESLPVPSHAESFTEK